MTQQKGTSESDEDAEEGVLDLSTEEDEEAPREIRYTITSYGADPLVDGLVKRLQEGDIYIPAFQRSYVWKKPQASRFVESLLLGLPVPGLFLAKDPGSAKQLVVDGQQRLQSLRMFYEGLFKDTDESKGEEFTLTGVQSKYLGKTYKSLEKDDRRTLDNAIIHATIVRQDSPEGDDSSIYQIFERLNTGGTLLHPQEIRACVSHGPLNELLGKLNRVDAWRRIYGPVSRRMKDRELILRFFTMKFSLESYKRPMKEALNKYMAKNRNLSLQPAELLEGVFKDTIEAVYAALGQEAFKPTKALNAAVFDSVMVGVSKRLDAGSRPSAKSLKKSYLDLLADGSFQLAYQKSTADEKQVQTRLQVATEYFAKCTS
ncbi:MAG: DUF262 domain-containing protein [Nitrososphaerota archaeon]|nr:DUF262 domain-containing protein [Nitrososphaerota archaeon]